MRLNKKILILPIILFIILSIFFLSPKPVLSSDQKQAIELFGYPAQFVITYLPRGSDNNPQLVRSETWLYPNAGKKITFLAGTSISVEDYKPEEDITQTSLKPEDYEFFQTYEDLVDIFGTNNITPIDFVPGLYEKGEYSTYITDQALFIIENNQLTYFQTLDKNNNPVTDEENTSTLTPEPTPISQNSAELKTYSNSDMGFEIKYPKDWFLNYGVLSSYDTDYMSKGLSLPDKRLKCDFISYNPDDIQIINPSTIIDSTFKIEFGDAQSSSEIEGPGLGDSKIFLISDNSHDPIALLCFSYHQDFQDKLTQMLQTFKFLN